MKKLMLWFLGNGLLLLFTANIYALTTAHELKTANSNSNTPTKYLFIQTAKNSTFIHDKNKQYILTLINVHPWVTYFSNAPKRETGFMTIDDYIKIFNEELIKHKNGLNAGLVAFAKNKHNQKTARYTFTFYKVNYDKVNDQLIYQVTFLPGEQTHQKPKNNLDFANTALFIDDVCASCGGRGF